MQPASDNGNVLLFKQVVLRASMVHACKLATIQLACATQSGMVHAWQRATLSDSYVTSFGMVYAWLRATFRLERVTTYWHALCFSNIHAR